MGTLDCHWAHTTKNKHNTNGPIGLALGPKPKNTTQMDTLDCQWAQQAKKHNTNGHIGLPAGPKS